MIWFFALSSVALASAIAEKVYFEELNNLNNHRNIRSALEHDLVLNLKRRNGDDVELHLRENKAINVNAPTYEGVYENGAHRAILQRREAIQGVHFYYDWDKNAALQVSCETMSDGKCRRQIEGSLEIDGETYDVQPIQRRLSTRYAENMNEIPHTLQKSEIENINFDDITSSFDGKEILKRNSPVLQQKNKYMNHRAGKQTYIMEALIAIDPPLWKLFVERTKNKLGTTEEAVVEKEARRYYSTLIHLVSMAYEGINDPDFTLKTVISGFLFFKKQTEEMLKLELYNEDGSVKEGLHFGEFLYGMYQPLRINGTLTADHVYTFTPTNVQSVAGANCLGCICETRGWGWSKSTGTSLSYEARTAAHEFGHGFGLYHMDKDRYTDMTCDPADGYVMGSTVKGRYWKFSECTIKKELKPYLAGTGQTCLLDNADVYNSNEWNAYTSKMPGEIRNITEQCIDVNRGKLFINQEKQSVLCNDVTDPDFCYDMYCVAESGCDSIAAADGTPCGLPSANKWCSASLCVSKTGETVNPETTGDAENCYKKWAETYLGTKNIAKSGYTCQRWDSNKPHSHKHNIKEKFLDASVADAANYCRDPTARETPWCFLDARWDFCDVPACSSDKEKQCADENWQYQKMQSKTKSGRTCQRWDSQEPHKHRFTSDNDFPDTTVADAGNFCRNPDNEPYAWCYTTDVDKRWELCDTKLCKDGTCYSKHVEYTGEINSTKKGIPCQNWDSNSPNTNWYKGEAEGNACRLLGENSPWCYLGRSWDYCDIPKCS